MFGLFGPVDLLIWYKLPVAFTVNNVMIYAGLKVAYTAYTYVYNPIPKTLYGMIPSMPALPSMFSKKSNAPADIELLDTHAKSEKICD